MTCWASASLKLGPDGRTFCARNRSAAAVSPSCTPLSNAFACFLRNSRLGFSGSLLDIIPPSCRPASAITGRREVDVRVLFDSGGIVPFRGRGASWTAASVYPEARPSASRCHLVLECVLNYGLNLGRSILAALGFL